VKAKQWLSNRSLLWSVAALAALLALLMLGGEGEANHASREEKRIAQVLSLIEGAGDVEVALFYTPDENGRAEQPTGALVVAQGADQLPVRLELIRAVRTLLRLPEAAVDVFAMSEGGK
jgi:hypothetical protein